MSLPAGVSTCTVTIGTAVDWFGRDVSIRSRCIPSARAVWAATGQPVLPFVMEVSGAPGEAVSFVLPHVDQEGFIDAAGNEMTGWNYRIVTTFSGTGGSSESQKYIQPVIGQTLIDLDMVPDGAPTAPTSTPAAAVMSVNGATGAVVVSLDEDPPDSGLYRLVVS